jgi:hypothetical protein
MKAWHISVLLPLLCTLYELYTVSKRRTICNEHFYNEMLSSREYNVDSAIIPSLIVRDKLLSQGVSRQSPPHWEKGTARNFGAVCSLYIVGSSVLYI